MCAICPLNSIEASPFHAQLTFSYRIGSRAAADDPPSIHSRVSLIHRVRSPSRLSSSLQCSAAAAAAPNPEALFLPLLEPEADKDAARVQKSATKITVVGVGNVGMACAQTILTQELAEELALVDVNADKLRGEMLDLQHAAGFLHRATISASTDYAVSAGSDVCVVTAGARQREGESRLDLVARNAALYRAIVPQLVRYSPDAVLLIVSNPVDVLTWVSWKVAGLPAHRVIGSGTNLDTSRLRFLLAEHFGANARDVQAYVLGEHGDSSVPIWSTVSVAGRVLSREPVKHNLDAIHREVVDSAYQVIRLKGYTSWAIGYSTASIVRNIVRDQRRINPVSVLAKGFHDIEEEVFLSLPVQLGRGGVANVVNSSLSEEEVNKLKSSARTLCGIQQKLGSF